jgi:hypothetical protein
MNSLSYKSADIIQRQYGYFSRKGRPKALLCMALSAIVSVSLITFLISVLL